ncbi:hypothetical protein GCM10020001_106290 [Nonomuraea salmonea]
MVGDGAEHGSGGQEGEGEQGHGAAAVHVAEAGQQRDRHGPGQHAGGERPGDGGGRGVQQAFEAGQQGGTTTVICREPTATAKARAGMANDFVYTYTK